MKRNISKLAILVLLTTLCISAYADSEVQDKLLNLEHTFDGKIGIYALDTDNSQVIAYRAEELFPVQSTFKLIGVGALLKKSMTDKALLQKRIRYTEKDFVFWSPISEKHFTDGMTLQALASATIMYSDNTAINLIMRELGGPEAVTAFAQAIGNKSFNVEHYEANLNSDPTNKEDTATPKDMAISAQKLMLGDILTPAQRTQLITWMQNNTTGSKRIRAGVPIGWTVADKTGSGSYGIANDIGITWSPVCKPIVLAIYTVQNKENASVREDIVSSATRIVFEEFAKSDGCMRE